MSNTCCSSNTDNISNTSNMSNMGNMSKTSNLRCFAHPNYDGIKTLAESVRDKQGLYVGCQRV